MAESLESFKSYIGKSETANDVVTASMLVKFAATLGLENPPLDKGLADSARLVRRLLSRVASTRQDAHRRAGVRRRLCPADSATAPAHRRHTRFVSRAAANRRRRYAQDRDRRYSDRRRSERRHGDGDRAQQLIQQSRSLRRRRTRYVHAQRGAGGRGAKNHARRPRRSEMATSRRTQCAAALSFLGDPVQ